MFSEALEMILSPDCPDDVDLEDETFMDIYQEASDLYGLIHARFIISPRGSGKLFKSSHNIQSNYERKIPAWSFWCLPKGPLREIMRFTSRNVWRAKNL